MKYKINEVFYSIQGEGYNVGRAAIFVRFAGCNLKCSFCDTLHSPQEELTSMEIIGRIASLTSKCKLVILTGGEPGVQVNRIVPELITGLQKVGYEVAMETNGTQGIPRSIDFITISPKISEPDYIPALYAVADEVKFVVTDNFGLQKAREVLKYIAPHRGVRVMVYLQPESERPEMIEKAIKIIKEEEPEWRLSTQVQKILDIR